MSDLISRQATIDYIKTQRGRPFIGITMEEAIITRQSWIMNGKGMGWIKWQNILLNWKMSLT